MNAIDPRLFDGIAGRKIANFHSDHVKQLLALLCQACGLADENGVLIPPDGWEPPKQGIPLNTTNSR